MYSSGNSERTLGNVPATTRGEELAERHEEYRSGGGPEISAQVEQLAEEKGATMAQISLAWLLHQDAVDAPIVGTTSVEHLEQAVEALDIDLSESDMEFLEEPYEPLAVAGHE